ncbi:DUF885 domain-containing protein [Solimonas marina]|uniref:DUF885 domain-containing protein n=1 Tax=Solimonas marina TaxID=2714601 RepID=A0A969WCP9_9GAMM|nr:DUF885 domain-containing protein [Solimonas marina]NKF23794.1 DUF885 domain-containing protein [Solimonas marina]
MKKLLAVSAALMLTMSAARAADAPAWVAESNRNAEVLLKVMAEFSPEDAGSLGVDGYDEQVIDLGPKLSERSRAALQQAIVEIKARCQKETDAAVLEDCQILIDSAQRSEDTSELDDKLLLPYYDVPNIVFSGIRALLDPRVPKARQAAALVRLRRYAGLMPGSTPIVDLAEARTQERFVDQGLIGPYRGEVEQNLSDAPRYIDGIEKLFADSGLKGYEQPLATLRQQLGTYNDWVRKTILPRARSDHRLPPAIYADNLKQVGVDLDPDELIHRAQLSFAEIQNEMRALAPLVAKEKGYKVTDYPSVIAELKKDQVTGEAILPLYRDTLKAIEDTIRRDHIVTLPKREAKIRLASEAESAQIPAPFMSPPRLIGNTGEYGEFVLPLKVPGKDGKADLKTDDFTFRAAAWTLTAHEARPGHELQFAKMIEKGVSTARAVFAFNSVNAEGWALYAEAIMKPTFPLDGQLIGLQFRLMRAARAFLDPMVNLGRITPDQVDAFLQREVGLSPGMARSETDRYVFRMPGQATAYFVGYQAMMGIRAETELALGDKFNQQRFHDFLLAQGLLPPKLLEKAVLEQFIPAELARKP